MLRRFTGCLHCGATRFLAGPRGAAAINVACAACGARFNIALPGRHDRLGGDPPWSVLLLEELRGPGEIDRELFGGYIIEVLPVLDQLQARLPPVSL